MRQTDVNFLGGKKFHFRHILALLLAALMIMSSVPVGYAAATPRRAVISAMEGSVLIQAEGQATSVPARKGMELKSGDRIITGKDGTAEIRYDDGSISRISPNSRIDLKDLSRESKDGSQTTALDNKWGKVWNNAKGVAQKNSRFQVNTPSAVASVRGTNFMVGVGGDQGTTVRVYDGTVGVGTGQDDDGGGGGGGTGSGGETLVGSLQQLDVGGEDPPGEPGDLDYLNIDDWEKDNLVEDNPGAYIQVEEEVKTLQLENAEERLQEELKNLAALNKELELIAQKLAAETDPAKKAQLQSLQQQLQNEQSSRQEIIKNIDKERQSLAEEKEKFAEFKERLPGLSGEELKEQARAARKEDMARAAEREKQQQQRAEQQKAAEEARKQTGKLAGDLGINEELEKAAESVTPELIRQLSQDMLTPPPTTQVGSESSSETDSSSSNRPPTAANVIISGSAVAGQLLTANYDYSNPDDRAEGNSTFRWLASSQSDGTYTTISGAAARTYSLAQTDVNKYIKVEVTPRDNQGLAGTPVQSAPIGPVQLQQYILTIEVVGQGSTTPAAGIHAYPAGTSVALTAVPASDDMQFQKWVINGTEVFAEETAITMNGDRTAIAFFTSVSPPVYGQISGAVGDQTTSAVLPGVTVILVQDAVYREVITNENGNYLIGDVPAGGCYHLSFSKTGYLEETYENISVVSDKTTYLQTVYLRAIDQTDPGNICGFITNALTGDGVSSLTILFRAGMNAVSGDIVNQAQTGEGGYYEVFDMAAGNYTGEVSGEGYFTEYFAVVVLPNETNTGNASISPELGEGETRAVLTWGDTPRDLDFHLVGPAPDGGGFHIYYGGKELRYEDKKVAALDCDDVDSYGPETISIYEQAEGVYTFVVHNWSGDGELTASDAKIEVYRNDFHLATFNVPNEGQGRYWVVFELEGDCITPINTFVEEFHFKINIWPSLGYVYLDP